MFQRVILLLSVIAVCGVAIASAWIIKSDRDMALKSAGRAAEDLALVLNREAESTVAVARALLAPLVEKVHRNNGLGAPAALHQALADAKGILDGLAPEPSFGHVFVIDARGLVFANSVSFPAKAAKLDFRPYFQVHRDTPGDGLHISQPQESVITGERVIYLTRRLEDATGAFLGVVGVQMKMRHFNTLYGMLNLPPGGSVALIRKDGRTIFHHPLDDTFYARDLDRDTVFRRMMDLRQGHLFAPAAPDQGVGARVVGFKASPVLPLLSVLSLSESSVLAGWHETAFMTALTGLSVILILGALAFVAHRQLTHLILAHRQSSRDPLTGLFNRRVFDRRLDEEWRRAMRHGRPLSLMYIDIDHFKAYNDSKGHQAGDACLVKVAQALARHVLRSGEVLARYGGEEFVILLPDTDSTATTFAGRKLVKAVSDLGIRHPSSPTAPVVTACVGAATMIPARDQAFETLLHDADAALYRAKHDGRNRFVGALPLDSTPRAVAE
ncbi:MAG: GGDEF domain-containing protein [Rhodobacterales bacterium]|nr:GGDEF domain-containing protein [Rhodobacterales bacterium]